MDESKSELVNVESLPPADLADRLERLPIQSAKEVLGRLPPFQSAAVLAELETSYAAELLEGFSDDQIAGWMQLLPPNITADLVMQLPVERRDQVLSKLAPSEFTAVTGLLRYPPESAGGIMDDRFIAVREDETVDQCLARFRASPIRRTVEIAYLYVADKDQRLVGVVPLREMVFAPADKHISEIMNRKVCFLRVSDDQEEIARQFGHYHFVGLPVVDEQDHLVGVVKVSDALRIAQSEATEDMQLMVGMSAEERIWTPWTHSILKRLPWLGVNVGTTLLAATVVGLFESTISRWTALVVFLPLISAVGGNAGIQALTVIIRGFAIGDVAPGDALRALKKELLIGVVNGFILGFVIGRIGFGWKGSLPLGIVAGAAMLFNQIAGALSGVAIPFGLKWCKVDPALASSIFVTTVTDIIGFFVFLGLAALAMRAYGM